MTNLLTAHQEWVTRPADERFADLAALHAFTDTIRKRSQETLSRISDLAPRFTDDDGLALKVGNDLAHLNHWTFGQLAGALGAPANYLRTLSPEIVRDCLYEAIVRAEGQCKLLLTLKTNGDPNKPLLTTTAMTGPAYGRIWDADVVEHLIRAVEGTGWHVPKARPAHGSENAGLYASDRDMFAFMVNDEQPIEVGNAKLGRGFFLWNSQTGAATFGLTTFLYNFVCGNHIVWGAEQIEELRIVHRVKAPERFRVDALPMLNRFVESRSSGGRIAEVVGRAMETRIGDDQEAVMTAFAGKPFTKKEIVAGYQAGELAGDDVLTIWGMVQGPTAHARTLKNANRRVDLERRAGVLLDGVL